jgi:hypothetical protein
MPPLSRTCGNAIKVNGLALTVPTAPAEAEKKLTEILCLGQSL